MCPSRETYACAVCSEKLPREFVHRNRAGAYICHVCQAERDNAGLSVRTWKRLLRRLEPDRWPGALLVARLTLALMVASLIVQLFA
jgi:hypothetical protein